MLARSILLEGRILRATTRFPRRIVGLALALLRRDRGAAAPAHRLASLQVGLLGHRRALGFEGLGEARVFELLQVLDFLDLRGVGFLDIHGREPVQACRAELVLGDHLRELIHLRAALRLLRNRLVLGRGVLGGGFDRRRRAVALGIGGRSGRIALLDGTLLPRPGRRRTRQAQTEEQPKMGESLHGSQAVEDSGGVRRLARVESIRPPGIRPWQGWNRPLQPPPGAANLPPCHAMSTNRVVVVERNLDAFLERARPAERVLGPRDALAPGSQLTARRAIELFEDQAVSRALDVAARELKSRGEGFYTISSAGHEQNAVLGAQLSLGDPCFLHYRAGAFMLARARKLDGSTPLFDTLLSYCASAEDPISQGRHKVWGSKPLWVPPQTSTIASHLPKASGMAFALGLARRLHLENGLARDAIVYASFGDATLNHASALAGIHAARYGSRRGNPMPILFACEDNGIGISVGTPPRWVEELYGNVPYLRYVEASGTVDAIWDACARAIGICRGERVPVFLHMRCTRLWGHAGTDVETAYRSVAEIEAEEARDPLIENARRLIETGAATPAELAAIVREARERVAAAAEEAIRRPKLASLQQIVAPLAPYDERRIRSRPLAPIDPERRRALFGGALPEEARTPGRRTLGAFVNAALTDELVRDERILVFGEDVGKKGGVYGVTQNLQQRFGRARVFDTLLDETTILGIAQGAAHAGLLPIPEISYLAYVHNAIDQLRGEACSLSFFSSGQFTNPMVVRIAGLAYQKGFGGHFHNDNSIGALREIPGMMIAVPARGDDAVRLLRGAVAIAQECGRVVVYLEPIALYHERDLHEAGDGAWLSEYPPPDGSHGGLLLPGDVGIHGAENHDLLIVSYANGLRLALRAARRLEREEGVRARVLDLRWLAPLPLAVVREHAAACGAVLVVDECRATGAGIADALVADLSRARLAVRVSSIAAVDTYVPLGAAANLVLLSEENILAAAREILA